MSDGTASGRPDGPAHDPRVLSTPALAALAAVAFVVELALFGGVGAIGYRAAGGGGLGWLVGVWASAAVIALWGVFMAPKARRRLGAVARSLIAFLLCTGTAVGLVVGGWTVWGWFVGVAGLAVVAVQSVLPGPARPAPDDAPTAAGEAPSGPGERVDGRGPGA